MRTRALASMVIGGLAVLAAALAAGHRADEEAARLPVTLAATPLAAPGDRPAVTERLVVVLDPGHGGSNTGCGGVVEGLYEKRYTLMLARQLAERLGREPGIVVKLTRADDSYVTLRERARRANAEGGDLFVSLHANASPTRTQRGFETYVLSPDALEVDVRAIRQEDGASRPGVPGELAALLDDVERGAAQPWGAELADLVQTRLAEVRPGSPDRGVKQAPMDVLMGPTMPAVLVEVGFFDHPVEGVELLKSDTRDAIVEALARAVLDFRARRASE